MSAMKHLYTLAQELIEATTILDELEQNKANKAEVRDCAHRVLRLEAELATYPAGARLKAIAAVTA